MIPPIKRRYGLLNELHDRLERIAGPEKILAYFLRRAVNFFDAQGGVVHLVDRATGALKPAATIGPRDVVDDETALRFLRNERPQVPRDVAMAPLLRDGGARGVVAIRRKGTPFQPGEGRFLCKIAALAANEVRRREEGHLREVRERIERKLLEDLRPEDAVYRILHGLKRLLRYDHSSAVLVHDAARGSFVLKAEQIAWKKGKSGRIGIGIPATAESVREIAREGAAFLLRPSEPARGGAASVAAALRFRPKEPGEPDEGVVLAAALGHRGTPVGILKVAARSPAALDESDLAVVRLFAGPAAAALHRSEARARLETTAERALRKGALADVARAVAHDVNNALGVAVPLLQQIAEEVRSGSPPERGVLQADLALVLDSLRIVKRVFSGMMAFARDARSAGAIDVGRCIAETLSLLEGAMARNGLKLETAVSPSVPRVRGNPTLFEQVLLNLVSNARDATPKGGTIRVGAAGAGPRVEIAIEDTGSGMDDAALERIREPFFTTKPDGSGLGLAICRAIVTEMGGDIAITSRSGAGTRVVVSLPAAGEAPVAESRAP